MGSPIRAIFPGLRIGTILLVVIVLGWALAGCGRTSGEVPNVTSHDSFAVLAILPTLEFSNAPQVILASAKDFRMLCQEAEVDRVLGRMDPNTGAWLQFALVMDGAFYVLPAQGYHTPYDRYDGERLSMPSAKFYYQLQRRERQEYKYRHYFVE